MNCTLLHQTSTHQIQINNQLDLFRLQIQSLTNIEPEEQVILFCPSSKEKIQTTSTSSSKTSSSPTPTTIILPPESHNNTPHPQQPYTATYQDVLQLLQHHDGEITACIISPYSIPSRILSPNNADAAALSIATFIGPLQMQEKTQIAIGTATGNAGQFYQRIQNSSKHVLMYEDKDLQRYALSKIPLPQLYHMAANDTSNPKLSFGDHLLRHFGHWFRNSFFKWMNGIPCSSCGHAHTKCIGQTRPNAEEIQGMCGTVEIYQCNACNANTRFPRYNHPRQLLESRIGRCGEFANCFTLFCRALGYDSRHITDWTDHVWTEIYSNHLQRWVSFDSCENAWDSPLMYSAGWGKKLTYVVACSRNDVVDVSSRYVGDYKDMMSRRTAVSERWLIKCIDALDLTARLRCATTEKTMLDDWSRCAIRRQREAASLEDRRNGGDGKKTQEKNDQTQDDDGKTSSKSGSGSGEKKDNQSELTEAEKRGRTTGSVEWRAARGELGSTTDAKLRALQHDVKCTTELPATFAPYTIQHTPSILAGTMLGTMKWPGSIELALSNAKQQGYNPNNGELKCIQKVGDLVYFYGKGKQSGRGGQEMWTIVLMNPMDSMPDLKKPRIETTPTTPTTPTTSTTSTTSTTLTTSTTSSSSSSVPIVTAVQVRAGSLIDCISFTVDNQVQHYGDINGGNAQAPFVLSNESIIAISGRCGNSLDAVRIHTNTGRESKLWGNSQGGNPFRMDAPVGMQIIGIVRADGNAICPQITDCLFAPIRTATSISPQQRMQERVRTVFERLVNEGKTPNEAAAIALRIVREEEQGK